MKDQDTIAMLKECEHESSEAWLPFIAEAERDLRVYLGDQWNGHDKQILRSQRREALVINKTHRTIHMVDGFQRKNRLGYSVNPVEGSDVETADQLSSVLIWVVQNDNIYNTISDAFSGSLKTGINLLVPYLDYSRDILNGDIKVARVPYNSFLLDPNMTKRDLSDCSYVIQTKFIRRQDLRMLLPEVEKEFIAINKTPVTDDPLFPYMQSTYNRRKDLYAYKEFWVRKTKTARMLIDQNTGQTTEWQGSRRELDRYLQVYPQLRIIKFEKPTVERHIVVNNQLLHSEENPYGIDTFPHVPVMCFWDAEFSEFDWKLQSLVRCMRDPQEEINKRRSQTVDMINSQLTTGWIFKESSVKNHEALNRAGQGGKIIMADESQITDLQRINPPDIPAGLLQLQEMFDRDVMEVPGANSELFGMAEQGDLRVAGVLAKMRQGAGITILQDLFDNLSLSQKLLGQRIVSLIQNNFTAAKVKRILNEEPTEEFYNQDFGTYDCVCSEGVLTDTQRNLFYMQLKELREMGLPVTGEMMLKAAPVQGHREIVEMLMAEEEKQKAQVKENRQQQALFQEMARAKMATDIAGSEEKRAQAVENREGAQLDRARTFVEMMKLPQEQRMAMEQYAAENQRKQAEAESIRLENEQKLRAIQGGSNGDTNAR